MEALEKERKDKIDKIILSQIRVGNNMKRVMADYSIASMIRYDLELNGFLKDTANLEAEIAVKDKEIERLKNYSNDFNYLELYKLKLENVQIELDVEKEHVRQCVENIAKFKVQIEEDKYLIQSLESQLEERNVSIQAIERHSEVVSTNEKLLDVLEETKNAYTWWIDEKGLIELDKSDYAHFEKIKSILLENGRTDH